jgi:hypothetical protein
MPLKMHIASTPLYTYMREKYIERKFDLIKNLLDEVYDLVNCKYSIFRT